MTIDVYGTTELSFVVIMQISCQNTGLDTMLSNRALYRVKNIYYDILTT